MIDLKKFRTLVDLLTYFENEQVCKDYLELIRWEGELKCAYQTCSGGKITKLKSGRYLCSACQGRYSVKVGTIFEDSKIPLRKWYAGIYLITSHKKGISSCQLARDLGVTQKTAWYMNHRVRHSLGMEPEAKLVGICEADESFIGGKEANKHKSKRTEGTQGRSVATKTAVAGVVSRGGELRAQVVPDTSGSNLRLSFGFRMAGNAVTDILFFQSLNGVLATVPVHPQDCRRTLITSDLHYLVGCQSDHVLGNCCGCSCLICWQRDTIVGSR